MFIAQISTREEEAQRSRVAQRTMNQGQIQLEFAAPPALARTIAMLPAEQQSEALTSLRSMAGSGNIVRTTVIFDSENAVRLFLTNQEKFIEISRACDGNLMGLFGYYSRNTERTMALFEMNPKMFVELVRAGGGEESIEGESAISYIAKSPVLTRLLQMHTAEFIEFTSAVKGDTSAFRALEKEKIAAMFEEDPAKCTEYFRRIKNATLQTTEIKNSTKNEVFNSLAIDVVASLFSYNPDEFAMISEACGSRGGELFRALQNFELAKIFIENPQKATEYFIKVDGIVSDPKTNEFIAFVNDETIKSFRRLINGEITFEQFRIVIYANGWVATQIGEPLDELHERPQERFAYLKKLSTEEVFGLLLSDPGNFYTTSNSMLFDRLKRDLEASGKSVSQLCEEYQVPDKLVANFVFRTIMYDRVYGKVASMLTEEDMEIMMPKLLGKLNSDQFDPNYYFLLSNAVDVMVKSEKMQPLLEKFGTEIADRYQELNKIERTEDQEKIFSALGYLIVQIDPSNNIISDERRDTIREVSNRGAFDPELYRGADGKVTLVQIFDKHDAAEFYAASQGFWTSAGYGNRRRGEHGELIYEKENTRVILYMGKDDDANSKFAKETIRKNPNMMMSFRGHSYSITNNIPLNTFEGTEHTIFLAGSCGSINMIPKYMDAAQDADIRYIANSGVGRGAVNEELALAYLDQAEKGTRATFAEVIRAREQKISAAGGDLDTIKVITSGGNLLYYVYNANRTA